LCKPGFNRRLILNPHSADIQTNLIILNFEA
jgi:hypothetical protein